MTCQCGGTGWVRHQDGDRTAVRQCDCLKRRIRNRRLQDLPERFRDSTFENYKPIDDTDRAALELLRSEPNRSFYMYGDYGRGKTHLAAAQYKAIVESGQAVAWRSMWDLIRELQEADTKDVTSMVIQNTRYSESFHLFVDDLDKFKASEYRDDTLYDVFDTIYRRRLSLTITTNYSLLVLAETGKLSQAIIRRIDETCKAVQV